ncbi:metallopeptidase family protein [Corynebacterium pacaense]|uniref:metallopeptidase family protein n=1 Tax=Corynebacterium pacaense TaxID=1816684 RepID=UPI0009B9A459|nr:metallopeptidase family protein [Corynebacterium pacaense]
MHSRTFRDRHGRGLRGTLLPTDVPRHATRRKAFDRAVLEAYGPIYGMYRRELGNLDIAVDTVPRMRLGAEQSVLPDEITADGPVPLGRVIPPAVDSRGNPTRARIVIFRMPIAQRASSPAERHELLTQVITSLVANYLNIDPRDIDPGFQL